MVGIDVVDVERLRAVLERTPGVREKLFTSDEIEYCTRAADPSEHFAGTLAAKEAIVKALGLSSLLKWAQRIEIVRSETGRPQAILEGAAARVDISISHDGGIAAAVALSLEGLGPAQF